MNICKYCGSAVPDGRDTCPQCGAHEFDHRCGQCGTVFSSRCCPQCGLPADAQARTCPNCGTRYFSNACPTCGFVPNAPLSRERLASDAAPSRAYADETDGAISPRSRAIALILAFFLGIFGIHRFYVGKMVSGVLYLCTCGVFGIGWLVDIILIATGMFKDKNGLPLIEWGT